MLYVLFSNCGDLHFHLKTTLFKQVKSCSFVNAYTCHHVFFSQRGTEKSVGVCLWVPDVSGTFLVIYFIKKKQISVVQTAVPRQLWTQAKRQSLQQDKNTLIFKYMDSLMCTLNPEIPDLVRVPIKWGIAPSLLPRSLWTDCSCVY